MICIEILSARASCGKAQLDLLPSEHGKVMMGVRSN